MIAIGWPETNGVFIDTSALPKFNTLDTNSGKSQNVKMLLPPLACLKMLFQNVALSELKSFPHPCLEMCKHYEILQLFENLKKVILFNKLYKQYKYEKSSEYNNKL